MKKLSPCRSDDLQPQIARTTLHIILLLIYFTSYQSRFICSNVACSYPCVGGSCIFLGEEIFRSIQCAFLSRGQHQVVCDTYVIFLNSHLLAPQNSAMIAAKDLAEFSIIRYVKGATATPPPPIFLSLPWKS